MRPGVGKYSWHKLNADMQQNILAAAAKGFLDFMEVSTNIHMYIQYIDCWFNELVMAKGRRWSWGHPAMTGMAPMAAASYIRKQSSRVLPPLPTETHLYIHGILLKKSSKLHTAALFSSYMLLDGQFLLSVKLWLLISQPHSYLLPLLLPLLSLSLIK